MNLAENSNPSLSHFKGQRLPVFEIPQITDACNHTKNLMVSIYLVERKHFLFCNKKLKELLGDRYNLFIGEGWDFWYSLIDLTEKSNIKDKLYNFFLRPQVQDKLAIKYHITDFYGKRIAIMHDIHLLQLESRFLAINYFFDVSEKEKIEDYINANPPTKSPCSPKKKLLSISPREKQVLQLIADGFSSKEIANMLFISNHTAISHRKNLIEKFQVKNTAHLVKRASNLMYL